MVISNLEMQEADTVLKGGMEGNHKASAILQCPCLSPAAFARFLEHIKHSQSQLCL